MAKVDGRGRPVDCRFDGPAFRALLVVVLTCFALPYAAGQRLFDAGQSSCDDSVPTIILRLAASGSSAYASVPLTLSPGPLNLTSHGEPLTGVVQVQGGIVSPRFCSVCESTSSSSFLGALGSRSAVESLCSNAASISAACRPGGAWAANDSLAIVLSAEHAAATRQSASVLPALTTPTDQVVVESHLSVAATLGSFLPSHVLRTCVRADVLVTPNNDVLSDLKPQLPVLIVGVPIATLVVQVRVPAPRLLPQSLAAALPVPRQAAALATTQGLPIFVDNPSNASLELTLQVPAGHSCWIAAGLGLSGSVSGGLQVTLPGALLPVSQCPTLADSNRFPPSVSTDGPAGLTSCVSATLPPFGGGVLVVVVSAPLPLAFATGTVRFASWFPDSFDPDATFVHNLPISAAIEAGSACATAAATGAIPVAPHPLQATDGSATTLHLASPWTSAIVSGVAAVAGGEAPELCGMPGVRVVRGGLAVANSSDVRLDMAGVNATLAAQAMIASSVAATTPLLELSTPAELGVQRPGQGAVSVHARLTTPSALASATVTALLHLHSNASGRVSVRTSSPVRGSVNLFSQPHGGGTVFPQQTDQSLLLPAPLSLQFRRGLPSEAASFAFSLTSSVQRELLPLILRQFDGEQGASPPVAGVSDACWMSGVVVLRDRLGQPASLQSATVVLSISYTVHTRTNGTAVAFPGEATLELQNGTVTNRSSSGQLVLDVTDVPSFSAAALGVPSAHPYGLEHAATATAQIPLIVGRRSMFLVPAEDGSMVAAEGILRNMTTHAHDSEPAWLLLLGLKPWALPLQGSLAIHAVSISVQGGAQWEAASGVGEPYSFHLSGQPALPAALGSIESPIIVNQSSCSALMAGLRAQPVVTAGLLRLVGNSSGIEPPSECSCRAGFAAAFFSSQLSGGSTATELFQPGSHSELAFLRPQAGALPTLADSRCIPCTVSTFSAGGSVMELVPSSLRSPAARQFALSGQARELLWQPSMGGCLPCPAGSLGPAGGTDASQCRACSTALSKGACGEKRPGQGSRGNGSVATLTVAGSVVSPAWMPWLGAVATQGLVLSAGDSVSQQASLRNANASLVSVGIPVPQPVAALPPPPASRGALVRAHIQTVTGDLPGDLRTAQFVAALSGGWSWVRSSFLALAPASFLVPMTRICPNPLGCLTEVDLAPPQPETTGVKLRTPGSGNKRQPHTLPSAGHGPTQLSGNTPPATRQRTASMCVEGSGLELPMDRLAWGAGMSNVAALYMPAATTNVVVGGPPQASPVSTSARSSASAHMAAWGLGDSSSVNTATAPWFAAGGVYGSNGSAHMCSVCGHGFQHDPPALGAMASCRSCASVTGGTTAVVSLIGAAFALLLIPWWVAHWADLVFESPGIEPLPALSLAAGLTGSTADLEQESEGEWDEVEDLSRGRESRAFTFRRAGTGARKQRAPRRSVYVGSNPRAAALVRSHAHRLKVLQRQWSRFSAPVMLAGVTKSHKLAVVPPRHASEALDGLSAAQASRRSTLAAFAKAARKTTSLLPAEASTSEAPGVKAGGPRLVVPEFPFQRTLSVQRWWAALQRPYAGGPMTGVAHGQRSTLPPPMVPPGESWAQPSEDGVSHVTTAGATGSGVGGAEVTQQGTHNEEGVLGGVHDDLGSLSWRHMGQEELWNLRAEALGVQAGGDTWRGTVGVPDMHVLDPPMALGCMDELLAAEVAAADTESRPPAPVQVIHPHRRVSHDDSGRALLRPASSVVPSSQFRAQAGSAHSDTLSAAVQAYAGIAHCPSPHSGILLQDYHPTRTGEHAQTAEAGGMTQAELDAVAAADPSQRVEASCSCTPCGGSSPTQTNTASVSDPYNVARGFPYCSTASAGRGSQGCAAWRANTLPRACACLSPEEAMLHTEGAHTTEVAQHMAEVHKTLADTQVVPPLGASLPMSVRLVFTGAPGLWRRRVARPARLLRSARDRVLGAGEDFAKAAKATRRAQRREKRSREAATAAAKSRARSGKALGPEDDSESEGMLGDEWTLGGSGQGGAPDDMLLEGTAPASTPLHAGLLRWVATTLLLQQVIMFVLLSHMDVLCPGASPDAYATVEQWWDQRGGASLVARIEKRLEDRSIDLRNRRIPELGGLPPVLGLSPLQVLGGASPVSILRDVFAGLLIVPVHSFQAACSSEREQNSPFAGVGLPLLGAAVAVLVLGALSATLAIQARCCWLSASTYDSVADVGRADELFMEADAGPEGPTAAQRKRPKGQLAACGLAAPESEEPAGVDVPAGRCTPRDGQAPCRLRCSEGGCAGLGVPSLYCHDVALASVSMTTMMLLPLLWHGAVMALPSFSTGLRAAVRQMLITQRWVRDPDEVDSEAAAAAEAEGTAAPDPSEDGVDVGVHDSFLVSHPATSTADVEGTAVTIMGGFLVLLALVLLLALLFTARNSTTRSDITHNAKVEARRIPGREGTFQRLLGHLTLRGHVDLRWWVVNLAVGGWYAAWLPLRARDIEEEAKKEAAIAASDAPAESGAPSIGGQGGSRRKLRRASISARLTAAGAGKAEQAPTMATPTGHAATVGGGTRLGMTYGEWVLRMWRRFGWLWGAMAPEGWAGWWATYYTVTMLLPLFQLSFTDPSARAMACACLMVVFGIAHEVWHPYVHRQAESHAADVECDSLHMVHLHVDMAPPREALLAQLKALAQSEGKTLEQAGYDALSAEEALAVLAQHLGEGASLTTWSTVSHSSRETSSSHRSVLHHRREGGGEGGGAASDAPREARPDDAPEVVGVEYNHAQAELHHLLSQVSVWSSVLQAVMLAVPGMRLMGADAEQRTSGSVCVDYAASLSAFMQGTSAFTYVPTPGLEALGGMPGPSFRGQQGSGVGAAAEEALYAAMHRMSWIMADVATARSMAVAAFLLPFLLLLCMSFFSRSAHMACLWCGMSCGSVQARVCALSCSVVGLGYDFVQNVLCCGFCRAVCCTARDWSAGANVAQDEDGATNAQARAMASMGIAPEVPDAKEVWRWLEFLAFTGRVQRGWADGGHPCDALPPARDHYKRRAKTVVLSSPHADTDQHIWSTPTSPRPGEGSFDMPSPRVTRRATVAVPQAQQPSAPGSRKAVHDVLRGQTGGVRVAPEGPTTRTRRHTSTGGSAGHTTLVSESKHSSAGGQVVKNPLMLMESKALATNPMVGAGGALGPPRRRRASSAAGSTGSGTTAELPSGASQATLDRAKEYRHSLLSQPDGRSMSQALRARRASTRSRPASTRPRGSSAGIEMRSIKAGTEEAAAAVETPAAGTAAAAKAGVVETSHEGDGGGGVQQPVDAPAGVTKHEAQALESQEAADAAAAKAARKAAKKAKKAKKKAKKSAEASAAAGDDAAADAYFASRDVEVSGSLRSQQAAFASIAEEQTIANPLDAVAAVSEVVSTGVGSGAGAADPDKARRPPKKKKSKKSKRPKHADEGPGGEGEPAGLAQMGLSEVLGEDAAAKAARKAAKKAKKAKKKAKAAAMAAAAEAADPLSTAAASGDARAERAARAAAVPPPA